MTKLLVSVLLSMGLMGCATTSMTTDMHITVATFNVSMEADNYTTQGQTVDPDTLFTLLAQGDHPQIGNIAQIIQRVRPDIILLNEFDYTDDEQRGVLAFVRNYLNQPQGNQQPIDYPYFYTAPVNTGVGSGLDLNRDGKISKAEGDAFGYGKYPGQYGMVLLSRFPIEHQQIRTFQTFLWQDMPNNLMSQVRTASGDLWYNDAAQQIMRLSSKSHWDIPVRVNGELIHILASHPTPPVFDGPEDRNGLRNHDEIRFWNDYIGSAKQAAYIYDDNGGYGGLAGERFVIVGDLNASASEGDGQRTMMADLLKHPRVLQTELPHSNGGAQNRADNPNGRFHTASWGLAVDYVIPSKAGFVSINSGIFWPTNGQDGSDLVASREASSDHRLVWRRLEIVASED